MNNQDDSAENRLKNLLDFLGDRFATYGYDFPFRRWLKQDFGEKLSIEGEIIILQEKDYSVKISFPKPTNGFVIKMTGIIKGIGEFISVAYSSKELLYSNLVKI